MVYVFYKKNLFEATEKANAELMADTKNFTNINPIGKMVEVSIWE
jgi:hypothetical protein